SANLVTAVSSAERSIHHNGLAYSSLARYPVAMLPRFFLPAALLASTLCAETTPTPSPSVPLGDHSTTITAAFWNIQWFPGRRPNASRYEENRQIRAVHRDLGQLNVDIIGLEEVRDFEHASVAVQPL